LHIKRCDNNFIILNKDKDVVCEAIIKWQNFILLDMEKLIIIRMD
jgi:hypothetical protein